MFYINLPSIVSYFKLLIQFLHHFRKIFLCYVFQYFFVSLVWLSGISKILILNCLGAPSLLSNYFFLCICCDYIKSSLVINMIFIYVYCLFPSFLKFYFVPLAQYPTPSHFVLQSYFDLLFYLSYVLIKFL